MLAGDWLIQTGQGKGWLLIAQRQPVIDHALALDPEQVRTKVRTACPYLALSLHISPKHLQWLSVIRFWVALSLHGSSVPSEPRDALSLHHHPTISKCLDRQSLKILSLSLHQTQTPPYFSYGSISFFKSTLPLKLDSR
ncbi:hypothetical protein YC2023_108746 [Brassica napus]